MDKHNKKGSSLDKNEDESGAWFVQEFRAIAVAPASASTSDTAHSTQAFVQRTICPNESTLP
jgi:hypothetical protein